MSRLEAVSSSVRDQSAPWEHRQELVTTQKYPGRKIAVISAARRAAHRSLSRNLTRGSHGHPSPRRALAEHCACGLGATWMRRSSSWHDRRASNVVPPSRQLCRAPESASGQCTPAAHVFGKSPCMESKPSQCRVRQRQTRPDPEGIPCPAPCPLSSGAKGRNIVRRSSACHIPYLRLLREGCCMRACPSRCLHAAAAMS